MTFDTLIGGYLLDPGTTEYSLDKLTERYLGTDLFAGIEEGDDAQLFAEDPWRRTAAEAAAVGLLAPVMEEQIDKQGLRSLLDGRRAAAVVGARADGGARHPPRRRLPGGDRRGRPRPDGDPDEARSTRSPGASST